MGDDGVAVGNVLRRPTTRRRRLKRYTVPSSKDDSTGQPVVAVGQGR